MLQSIVSGCADGSEDQIFRENMMVGCDGAYTKTNFRDACATGWHVATATEYHTYGGKTVVPTKARWVDVAWDFEGKETSLDNWEGYYPISNNIDNWYQFFTIEESLDQTSIQAYNNSQPLRQDMSCIWVSTNEKCKLPFISNDYFAGSVYGTSYGCHCRGNGINGTHGVVCVKDEDGMDHTHIS